MRKPIPSSLLNIQGQSGAVQIYDSRGRQVSVLIQVFAAVNIYISKDRNELNVDSTGVSKGGLLLPQSQINKIDKFTGILYAVCDQTTEVEVFEC